MAENKPAPKKPAAPEKAVYQFELNPNVSLIGVVQVKVMSDGVDVVLNVPARLISAPKGSAAESGASGPSTPSASFETFRSNLAKDTEHLIGGVSYSVTKIDRDGKLTLEKIDSDEEGEDELELTAEELFERSR